MPPSTLWELEENMIAKEQHGFGVKFWNRNSKVYVFCWKSDIDIEREDCEKDPWFIQYRLFFLEFSFWKLSNELCNSERNLTQNPISNSKLSFNVPQKMLNVPRRRIHDVFSALQFLHKKRIVHRDIRPVNILRVMPCWHPFCLVSLFGNYRAIDFAPQFAVAISGLHSHNFTNVNANSKSLMSGVGEEEL